MNYLFKKNIYFSLCSRCLHKILNTYFFIQYVFFIDKKIDKIFSDRKKVNENLEKCLSL